MNIVFAVVLIANLIVGSWQLPMTAIETPLDSRSEMARTDDYQIGNDDTIEVAVFEIPDLSGIARVTASGVISLPLIGEVHAAGLTALELGNRIEGALKEKYVNDPHVTVSIKDYGSQPVSIIGAVRSPGVYQMKGRKNLLDMIAVANGLAEGAGRQIQVIRQEESSGQIQQRSILIDTEELLLNNNAEFNIRILPSDVINVAHAGSVFIVGEVVRPGEFPLKQGKDITVVQALALGGGFGAQAKRSECTIFRPRPDGTKEEILVDIQKILELKAEDIEMRSNDVLWIPPNKIRSGFTKILDSVLSVAIGRAIYLR